MVRCSQYITLISLLLYNFFFLSKLIFKRQNLTFVSLISYKVLFDYWLNNLLLFLYIFVNFLFEVPLQVIDILVFFTLNFSNLLLMFVEKLAVYFFLLFVQFLVHFFVFLYQFLFDFSLWNLQVFNLLFFCLKLLKNLVFLLS